ncbi:MAG: sigma-70 family RNA polymerase sigma factor [Planctomycetota bacterium]
MSSTHPPRFQSTHWSLIVRATGDRSDRGDALEALCQGYWYPVYAFVRRRGLDRESAEDFTQDFFAALIDGGRLLQSANPSKGRFRTYLLAAVKHRLANWKRDRTTQKRGGHVQTFSVDWADAEQKYAAEPTDGWTPETVFHRRWAMTVLARVLDELKQHYADRGRTDWFEAMRPMLVTAETPDYASLAERLDASESAVRVALHRLRKHYADALRVEIGATLDDDQDADAERIELLRALTGK